MHRKTVFGLLLVWSITLVSANSQTTIRAGIVTSNVGDQCAGTMVNADEVLTAAHCLFDSGGVAVPPESLIFHSSESGPLAVVRAVVHPKYTHEFTATKTGIESDLALLVVNNPMSNLKPVVVGAGLSENDTLMVQRDASDQLDRCTLMRADDRIFTLDCLAVEGESGTAIYKTTPTGSYELVGLISATETEQGLHTIIAVRVGEAIDVLRTQLDGN